MTDDPIDCVIPTHGRPEFLGESLRSVAEQTLRPARVVVVSDDADHRTSDVVRAFQHANPDIDCVFAERTTGGPGASASRNEGARLTVSPVIAFLDDDDLWEPDYLRSARAVLASQSVDAVVTPFQRFSAAGVGAVVTPLGGLTPREVFRRAAGVTGSSLVVRRATFDALGGFDSRLPVQNDRDFFLRLLSARASYGVADRPLVRVRDHDGGRLTDASVLRADGILVFLHKHGRSFSSADRRILRYVSHRTRLSSAASPVLRARSLVAAVANWSPTAARQIPLGLFRRVGWPVRPGPARGRATSPSQ